MIKERRTRKAGHTPSIGDDKYIQNLYLEIRSEEHFGDLSVSTMDHSRSGIRLRRYKMELPVSRWGIEEASC
jgi:hypothetical protein